MKSNLFHFYFAAFFAGAFLGAELFGFAAFFGDADFFAGAFVDFGFVGVVAFFTLDVVDFFVDAFFVPTGLATLAFVGLAFFVALAALADFGVALERGLTAFGAATFFDFAAEASAVAELLTLDDVATFFAGFDPADFDRGRFFVVDVLAPVELVAGFFGLLVFFFVAVESVLAANLNEPLAPLPLVCFNKFDLTPFFNANFKC